MTTTVKKLKALLGFHATSDTDLIQQLLTVYNGTNGNPAFANPPVDLAAFKSGIDTLAVLVTEAADGGKKAISAKSKQREVMIKQAMSQRCVNSVVIADSSKWGRLAPYTVIEPQHITRIITTEKAPDDLISQFRSVGVQVDVLAMKGE